jgi:hypothetical protein
VGDAPGARPPFFDGWDSTSAHRLGFFADRRKSGLYPFSSQASVVPVTDTYPPVGDNGIDLCVMAEVCPSTKTAPEAAQPIWQVLFDNLSRLADVSGAGARWRNPERSEGSGTLRRLAASAEILTLSS